MNTVSMKKAIARNALEEVRLRNRVNDTVLRRDRSPEERQV